MSLRSNIPDPDDTNEQRSLWAEVALQEFYLEAEGVGEQFDGFEQLVPAYEPPEKPVQNAPDRDAEDARRAP
jgi:hypothetical protein